MVKFIPVKKFLKATKMDRMTFIRKKKSHEFITVRLYQEFIVVKENMEPVEPINLIEYEIVIKI